LLVSSDPETPEILSIARDDLTRHSSGTAAVLQRKKIINFEIASALSDTSVRNKTTTRTDC